MIHELNNYWVVVNMDGKPCIETIAKTEEESIDLFGPFSLSPGYRCIQVNIKMEEVK